MKQEVKDKIEKQCRIICDESNGSWIDIAIEASEFGYNLAMSETESPKVEWIAEQVHMEVVKDLTDELSTAKARIAELEKENERLRGLVEKAFKAGHPHNWQGVHTSKQQWEKFKANNNL